MVDKLSKDRPIEDYVDVPEEALRPEDSGTIYAHCMEHIQLADERYGPCSKTLDALKEALGLDQEVKRHIPKYEVCSKNLHGPSQIHGLSKQPHRSKQIHGPNQFVKHDPCLIT